MRRRLIAAGLAAVVLVMIVAAWAWWTAYRIDLSRLAEPSVVYAAGRAVEAGMSVTTIGCGPW